VLLTKIWLGTINTLLESHNHRVLSGRHSRAPALVHGRPAGLKRNENTITVVYDDQNKHPAEIKYLETIKELARNSSIQWLAHKPKQPL